MNRLPVELEEDEDEEEEEEPESDVELDEDDEDDESELEEPLEDGGGDGAGGGESGTGTMNRSAARRWVLNAAPAANIAASASGWNERRRTTNGVVLMEGISRRGLCDRTSD